jgi:signal transduction histidine kinase
MEKVIQIQRLLLRSRRLPWLLSCLALLILAGAVLFTQLQLRQKIRVQIAGRDAEVLYPVALWQYEQELEQDLGSQMDEVTRQLTVLLKTSQLKGIMGARLFDPNGRFVQAFPPDVLESPLEPQEMKALRELRPTSRFYASSRLSKFFLPDIETLSAGKEKAVSILKVSLPLHSQTGPLAGVVQFLIEGQSIAAEFSRLDRSLLLQGLATFAAGGGLLLLAIAVSFRRLRRAHQLLGERTEGLAQANQELALLAKTSALGIITAHLIHGLKNPLAGLQQFVAERPSKPFEESDSDWLQAIAATRRMHAMIEEVMGLLREEQTGIRYEIALEELGDIVAGRVLPLARQRQVDFKSELKLNVCLPNRTANLVTLTLANLVENAIEATPPGKEVLLSCRQSETGLIFDIRDQGPGFPEGTIPFTPCRSSKEGGSGIGLALCKQLAGHLGAGLELKSNTPRGCIFSLTLPVTLCMEPADRLALPRIG